MLRRAAGTILKFAAIGVTRVPQAPAVSVRIAAIAGSAPYRRTISGNRTPLPITATAAKTGSSRGTSVPIGTRESKGYGKFEGSQRDPRNRQEYPVASPVGLPYLLLFGGVRTGASPDPACPVERHHE